MTFIQLKTSSEDASTTTGPSSNRGKCFNSKLRWSVSDDKWNRGKRRGKPFQLQTTADTPAQGPWAVWGNTETTWMTAWVLNVVYIHYYHLKDIWLLVFAGLPTIANGCCFRMEISRDTCTCKTSTSRQQTTSPLSKCQSLFVTSQAVWQPSKPCRSMSTIITRCIVMCAAPAVALFPLLAS